MLGILVCPECGERVNIELNREFTKVRCQKCGRILSRDEDLEKQNDE